MIESEVQLNSIGQDLIQSRGKSQPAIIDVRGLVAFADYCELQRRILQRLNFQRCFGAPRTIQRVKIHEALPGRVQKFEFQYRDGDAWKTIFSGTTLSENFEQQFAPVTAREFRLNILEATDGPTISEIELQGAGSHE